MARFDFQELVERLPLVVYVDQLDDKSSPLYVNPQIANLLVFAAKTLIEKPFAVDALARRVRETLES